MNSTHTVIIQKDQRGLKFLIGLSALFLLIRWMLTGKVLMLSEAFSTPGGGMGSITGVLFPIGIDLIVMTGGILLAVFSGVWAVAWDVISGVIEMIKIRNAKSQAINAAVEAATGAGTLQAAANSGAIAGVAAASAEPSTFEEKVRHSFREHRKRIEALELAVFPPPPPEPTVEELKAALAEKEALLADYEANKPARATKAKAGA
jgi:hypothetical protein